MVATRPTLAVLALCCLAAAQAAAAANCNVFGCAQCNADNPDACAKCRKGYELNGNVCDCADGYGSKLNAAVKKAPKNFPTDCNAPTGRTPTKATCRCRRCPRGTTSTGGPIDEAQCVEAAKAQASSGGQASLMLSGCGGNICNGAAYSWDVTKEALTPTISAPPQAPNNVATWEVNVTKSGTPTKVFKLVGVFRINNTGSAPAPIGNIVVNLQTRVNNKWKTFATDAADAYRGDLSELPPLTPVNVVPGASSEGNMTFFTSAATGTLLFDKNYNTIFSIDPAKVLKPGESVDLTYSAAFKIDDPAALGTAVRAEVIVSFWNAGGRGSSGASMGSLDITGDGATKPESNVRSVPCRTTITVPAQTPWHDSVTLSDDFTAAGTVITCANIALTLRGATSPASSSQTCPATLDSVPVSDTTERIAVTATITAGENGDMLTNTAYIASPEVTTDVPVSFEGVPYTYNLKCYDAVDDFASATVTLTGESGGPTPGDTKGYFSYSQAEWESSGNSNKDPIKSRNDKWNTLYPSGAMVGKAFMMTFTTTAAVDNYLLQMGQKVGVLTENLLNPKESSADALGGEVLALKFNVEVLGDRGIGGLYVCGNNALAGNTVAQILDKANTAVGGGGGAVPGGDLKELKNLLAWINFSCQPNMGGGNGLDPVCFVSATDPSKNKLPSKNNPNIRLSAASCA